MGSHAHRILGLALVLAATTTGVAVAQTPAGTQAGGAGTAPPPAQTGAPSDPTGGGAGAPAAAGSAAAPEKPKGSTEGFTFTDKPAPRRTGGVRIVRRGGPVATMPGFEETSDGGSRLFVTLTQSVPVEERRGQGTLTYVLKGAHITRHNNANALVTVHFNTPVSRARLVPQGNDLLFVVDLRAAATPTFKVAENADHTAMLTIDFPKGDFTNAVAPSDQAPAQEQPKPIGKKKKAAQQQPQDQGGGTGPNP